MNVADLITVIASVDPSDMPAILAACASRLAQAKSSSGVAAEDKLLDVDEAAALLGVSRSWLHHRPQLPFRRKIGGKLKFSKAGILRWQQHDHHSA
jgi:predicted DNA-binding transcriptional regulator AlpA